MQVTKKQERQVTLVLDEDEAHWLNTVMQNPLHGDEPDAESY